MTSRCLLFDFAVFVNDCALETDVAPLVVGLSLYHIVPKLCDPQQRTVAKLLWRYGAAHQTAAFTTNTCTTIVAFVGSFTVLQRCKQASKAKPFRRNPQ